ncbi:MAG: GNAT family N-acetyltransferase [Fuerstia sp.]|nr:GNAT family N-acetyltransferase [Fuerstiella sp.]
MLVGKNVRLRILDSTDTEYMRRLRNSPDVIRGFQWRNFISDVRQAAFYESVSVSSEQMYFIAESLHEAQPFGVYFIRNLDHRNQRGENGVFLDPQRTTTGVESIEAAFLLLEYEFTYLNLHKVCAEVLSENTRAIRFNEAIGMQCEGVLRQHVYYDGAFRDLSQFCLFRDDFLNRPTPVIRSLLATRKT